jgi:hypothetical protein
MLILFICVQACATLDVYNPPALENRRLDVSPDRPGFVYKWTECSKKFLGICRKTVQREDFYDLTNPAVRKELFDMGFTATSERKNKP